MQIIINYFTPEKNRFRMRASLINIRGKLAQKLQLSPHSIKKLELKK